MTDGVELVWARLELTRAGFGTALLNISQGTDLLEAFGVRDKPWKLLR